MGVVLEAPFNNGKDAAFNHFLAIVSNKLTALPRAFTTRVY